MVKRPWLGRAGRRCLKVLRGTSWALVCQNSTVSDMLLRDTDLGQAVVLSCHSLSLRLPHGRMEHLVMERRTNSRRGLTRAHRRTSPIIPKGVRTIDNVVNHTEQPKKTGKYVYYSSPTEHCLDFQTKNFHVHETTVYTLRPVSGRAVANTSSTQQFSVLTDQAIQNLVSISLTNAHANDTYDVVCPTVQNAGRNRAGAAFT